MHEADPPGHHDGGQQAAEEEEHRHLVHENKPDHFEEVRFRPRHPLRQDTLVSLYIYIYVIYFSFICNLALF